MKSQGKISITIRLDADVLAWAKKEASAAGLGYQSFLNDLLRKAKEGSVEIDRMGALEKRLKALEGKGTAARKTKSKARK